MSGKKTSATSAASTANPAAPAKPKLFNASRERPREIARHFEEHLRVSGIGALQYHDAAHWHWNGQLYKRLTSHQLDGLLYAFLEQPHVRNGDKKTDATTGLKPPFNPKSGDVDSILDALAGILLEIDASMPTWVDKRLGPNPLLMLPCSNGLVNLLTRDLTPHTPNFFCDNCVPYTYDANAVEPKHWLTFLNDIWGDDPASIETLHEIMGYLLTCDTDQQKIFALIGPKRSGKGTISHVMQALVGTANIATPSFYMLSQQFGMQSLIGKRIAVLEDARMGHKLDASVIVERLLSISGEDTQTIDRKYLSAWVGRLFARFLIVSNELPRLPDASGALTSRLLVLKTVHSFIGHEDHLLRDKLDSELPGILNLAIDGLHRLNQRGYFVQPESARTTLENMLEISSPISMFVEDFCEVVPGRMVEAAKLYEKWRKWREDEGVAKIETHSAFAQQLYAAFPTVYVAQPRITGKPRMRVYMGIGTKSDAEKSAEKLAGTPGPKILPLTGSNSKER